MHVFVLKVSHLYSSSSSRRGGGVETAASSATDVDAGKGGATSKKASRSGSLRGKRVSTPSSRGTKNGGNGVKAEIARGEARPRRRSSVSSKGNGGNSHGRRSSISNRSGGGGSQGRRSSLSRSQLSTKPPSPAVRAGIPRYTPPSSRPPLHTRRESYASVTRRGSQKRKASPTTNAVVRCWCCFPALLYPSPLPSCVPFLL